MLESFGESLGRILRDKMKALEEKLAGREIEIEMQSSEDAPPLAKRAAPKTYGRKNPVLQNTEALRQFQALTQTSFQSQQYGFQSTPRPTTLSEEEKQAEVEKKVLAEIKELFPQAKIKKR